jgi:hypothetical protein
MFFKRKISVAKRCQIQFQPETTMRLAHAPIFLRASGRSKSVQPLSIFGKPFSRRSIRFRLRPALFFWRNYAFAKTYAMPTLSELKTL